MSLNLAVGSSGLAEAPIASLGTAASSQPPLFPALLTDPAAERVYLIEAETLELADLVTDGDFDGTCGVEWTCQTGVSIASSKLSFSGAQTGTTHGYQSLSGWAVTGETYQIDYTITALSAGTLQVIIGGSPNVGTVRTASGTYRDTITWDGTGTEFIVAGDTDLIADVSIVALRRLHTRRYSDEGYITKPSDTLANTAFPARAISPYETSRTIPIRDRFQPRTQRTIGDIILANTDGGLDTQATAESWDGREITVKLGRPTFDYTDFGTIFKGRTRSVSSDEQELKIALRDVAEEINKPVQDELFTCASSPCTALEELNLGRPKPISWGKCRYVEPVLINDATKRYKVHLGAVQAINTVYDQGTSVAFTSYASSGEFTVTSAPAGLITATVQGCLDSSSPPVYVDTPSTVFRRVIDLYTDLVDPDDLDVSSFTTLETDVPYTIGLFARDKINTLDLLDAIMNSVAGYWTVTREGLIRVGRIQDPSPLSADEEFDDDDILSIELRELQPPAWRVTVGYQRTWRTHSDGEIAGVALGSKPTLTEKYRSVTSADESVKNTHAAARDMELSPTLLDEKADAQAIADTLLALHKESRELLYITVKTQPYILDVGDVVQVTSARFGLSAGKKFLVVGLRESALTNNVELSLWG